MKGTIRVSKLRRQASYSRSDVSPSVGGYFVLYIEPFSGKDGERFFYACNCEDGSIELEGEGYILDGGRDAILKKLRKYQKEAREALGSDVLWYYWLDKDGNTVNKVPMYADLGKGAK